MEYIAREKYTDTQLCKIDSLRNKYDKIKIIRQGDCGFSMMDCRDERFDNADTYLVSINVGHRLFWFRGTIDAIIEYIEEFLIELEKMQNARL